MSPGKSAVHIIGGVAMITLIAKLLGFVREMIQARAFGAGADFGVYSAAYNATDYLFTTIGYALCVAAIPIITQRIRADRAEGMAAANNIICVTVVFSLVVMGLGLLFPYAPWIYPRVSGTELALYNRILMLTLPVVVLTYLFLALLQSLEHYMLQGSLSLPYNAFLIVFLFAAAPAFGITGLVVAVALAWLLQLAMTIPPLVREKYRFRFTFDLRAPYMGVYLKTAAVTVFTTATYLFCYLIDTSVGANLGDDVLGCFYYADKVFAPVATTLAYSISIVMFPKFNFKFVDAAAGEYKRYVWNAVEKTVMLMIPLSIIFAVFAVPMVKVIFEGDQFTAAATVKTGRLLYFYLVGMTGFAVLDILAKAYFTMNRVLTPLLVNLGVIALNVVLNFVFRGYPDGSGLAFATAVSLTLGAIVLALLFFAGLPKQRALLRLAKCLLAAAVMTVLLLVSHGLLLVNDHSKLVLIVLCLALGGVAFLIYTLLCAAMGEKEILHVLLKKREKPE